MFRPRVKIYAASVKKSTRLAKQMTEVSEGIKRSEVFLKVTHSLPLH